MSRRIERPRKIAASAVPIDGQAHALPSITGGVLIAPLPSSINHRKGIAMPETTYPKTTTAEPVGSGPNFVDRLAKGAHQAVDQAAASAKPALEKLQESGAAAREVLAEKAEAAASISDDLIDSVRNYVRERPLTVVAGAVALGIILAGFSRSR